MDLSFFPFAKLWMFIWTFKMQVSTIPTTINNIESDVRLIWWKTQSTEVYSSEYIAYKLVSYLHDVIFVACLLRRPSAHPHRTILLRQSAAGSVILVGTGKFPQCFLRGIHQPSKWYIKRTRPSRSAGVSRLQKYLQTDASAVSKL